MSTLHISKLAPDSDPLLRNLFEYYVHDMSEWLPIETKPDGSYSYDTSKFWTDGYDVYLAMADTSIVGFAIIGSADPWLGPGSGAHDVHEFFILRRFRRSGAGRELAKHLWNQYPGEWLVRVFEENRPAVPFWQAAISAYTSGAYTQQTHSVNERDWRFFRFRAGIQRG